MSSIEIGDILRIKIVKLSCLIIFEHVVLLYMKMEATKDVLCFLNGLDFADKLDNDYLENIVEVRKTMVREFEDYNISKMTCVKYY